MWSSGELRERLLTAEVLKAGSLEMEPLVDGNGIDH